MIMWSTRQYLGCLRIKQVTNMVMIYCSFVKILGLELLMEDWETTRVLEKGTSRQRSGKGAIRKRFPLQKPRWEKTKLTIGHLYHEIYRKPNEQLFSQ